MPETWPSKDPDAILDYRYNVPLDTGDTVVSATLELLAGTVAIDSQVDDDTGVTAWLSGGADGETVVFRVSWVTDGGREDDDTIILPVLATEPVALALTGYAKPLAAHLAMRYPAFADVPVATVRMWLTDAERFVDTSWAESDYAAALMALAAHNMASAGLGSQTAAGSIPAGVTSFRSGAMSITVSEAQASRTAKGGYQSTIYGQEFAAILRRNFAGPRLIAAGTVPACAYPY